MLCSRHIVFSGVTGKRGMPVRHSSLQCWWAITHDKTNQIVLWKERWERLQSGDYIQRGSYIGAPSLKLVFNPNLFFVFFCWSEKLSHLWLETVKPSESWAFVICCAPSINSAACAHWKRNCGNSIPYMQRKLRLDYWFFVEKRRLITDVRICHPGRASEGNGQCNHQPRGACREAFTHINTHIHFFIKTQRRRGTRRRYKKNKKQTGSLELMDLEEDI